MISVTTVSLISDFNARADSNSTLYLLQISMIDHHRYSSDRLFHGKTIVIGITL